jgi:integrase
MNDPLTVTRQGTVVEPEAALLVAAGRVANEAAAGNVFADYLSRKAENSARTQAAALALFAEFLGQAGIRGVTVEALQHEAAAWRGVTWGLVEAFVKWLLKQGHSVASVNNRLSAVKVYARLATKAGAISPDDLALIKTVSGYAGKEAKRINERRPVTRIGEKKAQHVPLTAEQARKLKDQDLTAAQGARDGLLMALLLDHGLRVGELAGLKVKEFDLKRGEVRFYRPKVDKIQTHKLTADTLRAARAYFDFYPSGQALTDGHLLLATAKGGKLQANAMSERAITKRVAYLGARLLGLSGLSAHDCRHYWATDAARNGTDPFRLQEAGGWSSLTMPRRYVEDARIANQGVKLSL